MPPSPFDGRRTARVRALASALLLLATSAAADEPTVHDPWEPMNRRIFWFNETADRYVIEPVAIGWDTVLPDLVQECISNFFRNLAMPPRLVNALLQGKPVVALEEVGRFLVNTTVGLGGLFDPATPGGIPLHDEDFGQTLGVWGVPPGPYLVLPILGPSSPRDAVGLAADGAMTPPAWIVPMYVSVGVRSAELLNRRSQNIEEIRAERESAFDFYVFVRNAYVQYRENQVRDRADEPDEAQDDDLYYFDDEEDY